ncbi:hypothetical protein [Nesterenkonia sp. F]|uniref:hypothetical protein n=1 Tax=Nesterenkonia sp. F TaxID=795955 RepID=UPI000255D10A|nr:hypothetical protein [Nesterenkonia sp. F]
MRTPRPLPEELLSGVFPRSRALALGVPPNRLRARDVERVGRGLYRVLSPSGALLDGFRAAAEGGRFAHVDADLLSLMRALQLQCPGMWFSHTTAAHLWNLPLPPWLDGARPLHVSRAESSSSTDRIPGLVAHAVVVEDGEVVDVEGLRVSRPGRAYFDLMGVLPLHELVALGDQLIRRPNPELEGRDRPWETPASLRTLVGDHRKTRGIVAGREALERIRDGADSRPETLLRLAIVDAGLPEPQLQVTPRPGSPWSGDLGYEEEKVVLQYEGEGHFNPTQQASDRTRNAAFVDDGWTVVIVNVVDLRDRFRGVVRRVDRLLHGP